MKAYRAKGANAGSMPVLEDGMTINQVRFNAREEQWIEAANLSLETVARAWHINPAMLGATGGVSYANVREFRKMLYGETLGPWLKMIQDRINSKLVPLLDPRDGVYVEFNVKAKLAASFDEQAAVLSSAVGRPWMTANEARALENMPALEGDADALVTPLNVLVGGQVSPRDSAPKSGPVLRKAGALAVKGEADAASERSAEAVLQRFFKRQREAVLAKLRAEAPEWWDAERWNSELSDDLYKLAMSITGQVAADVLSDAGFGAGSYDSAVTEKFLRAVADSRASKINDTTLEQIEAVLDDPGEDDEGNPIRSPEKVFEDAQESRGGVILATLLTTFAGFATMEAAKQNSSEATKTWVVNSKDPRSEHSRMAGETVPVREKFSNGADWPGDPVLGASGVSNCRCIVQVSMS
jgi:hypothetical protein